MGIASWAPLIKMTIVELISFGDLNLKKQTNKQTKNNNKKIMFHKGFLNFSSFKNALS